jgi:PBSX family phage terminase large subunit
MDWGEFGEKSTRFIMQPVNQDARINILDGSVRSAKTVTMIPKWINYIRTGPSGLLLMTGKSRDTLKSNVLNDLFDTVGTRNYNYNKQYGDLTIFGREIKCMGIKDEGSEEYIRGKTLAGCYSDECVTTPESCFLQILNRLSVPGSKYYGTTNPDSPYHYLHRDFLNDPKKLASGMVSRWHFQLEDNPNLDPEYVDFIKAAYSGLWYRRMILGQWVQAEGAIYDMIDHDVHFLPRGKMPVKYDRYYVGVDYGAGNPTVFVLIGVRYDPARVPTAYVAREYYHDPRKAGSKTAQQYKADFIRFIGDLPVKEIYADPSALDFRNELQSSSCGREFTNLGRTVNDVLPGINTVATMFSQERLFINRDDCPETCNEHVSYLWDAKAQQRGEDAPVKDHDHTCDAVRYPLHSVFPASAIQGWMRRAS